MNLFIPQEAGIDREKIFPFLTVLSGKEDEIGDISGRTTSIYQIMELLAMDGRLDKKKIGGDVCCLDVGNIGPEIVVFDQLQAKSITVAEGFEGHPRALRSITKAQFKPERALVALENFKAQSFDLITMFNAFCKELDSEAGRLKLIHELDRVLKNGGNFLLTSDSAGVYLHSIQALEKLVGFGNTTSSLEISLPQNSNEPMWGKGWVMRSILMENMLGFDFDKLRKKANDKYHDAMILCIKKV